MPRPKKEQPNHAGGLYEVKITIGKTLEGKLIRKSFYSSVSKEDARRRADEWKIQREVAALSGEGFIENQISFRNWALRWAETYKKPNVDSNTYRITYLHTIQKHLIPYFGDANLSDIRQIDIVKFYAAKQCFSESMLKKMQLCLNAIFNTAIDNNLCYKNPAKDVGIFSYHEKTDKRVYTDKQIKIVEEFAKDRMPEVIILLETGLRRGELLGLQWNDVDLEAATITVKRSIADKHGGGVSINTPKLGSYRTNPLSQKAIVVFNAIPRNNMFIFPSPSGNAQSPNSWSRKLSRFMADLAKNCPEVPPLTAHELRHTYGTKLRRDGADIYSIQKIMGHKDIKMTTEIYVHNEIEALRMAIKNSL